jgi:hypothetical protein
MLFILKPYKLIFNVIEKRKSLWCMAYHDGIPHSVIERRISALNPPEISQSDVTVSGNRAIAAVVAGGA